LQVSNLPSSVKMTAVCGNSALCAPHMGLQVITGLLLPKGLWRSLMTSTGHIRSRVLSTLDYRCPPSWSSWTSCLPWI